MSEVPSQSAAKPAGTRARSARPSAAGPADAEPPPSAFASAPDGRQIVTLASLTQLAEAYLPQEDLRRIREAYRFSDDAHLGQFRTSGEPYISHPIEVAKICAGWKLDTESLMAALLHDVMEDTGASKQTL
ncbi:MAG TPA: HD domain-containing protein, partial [Burkholderiaceae bacterium]|nr:HD domain-containing protein [Burkholderiaceae bacterium]